MTALAAGGRSALDVLPMNVAVLDPAGEILETNASWDEFAGEAGAGVGTNYLETAREGDVYARRAVEGIEKVAAGDREVFTMEYPCHTAEKQQWFLMRVGQFQEDGVRRLVVAHVDVTERKLTERAAERRAAALEHILDRLNGLVEEVTRAMLEASSRVAVERGVCRRFVEVDPYEAACVWQVDLGSDSLSLSASTGIEPDDATLDGDSTHDPVVAAYRSGEPRFVQDVTTLALDSGECGLLCREHGSVAALPLVYDGSDYGVLALYADGPTGFGRRERAVLTALARMVAHAINDRQTKQLLTADEVVELTFETDADSVLFAALSGETGCRLRHRGTAFGSDTQQLHVRVDGDATGVVLAAADDRPDIADVHRLVDHENGALFEFTLTGGALTTTLVDHGARPEIIEGEDGVAVFRVVLPKPADPRALVRVLEERYDAELTGYREREQSMGTRLAFRDRLAEELTDRQRTALRRAHAGGFFASSRRVSGDELAASMDISRSTFHQHLRAAQRKVLDALLDPDAAVPN